jgi:hypothetical protein
MEKEFVPYDRALKLKELGFNEPCFGYYYTLNGKDWKFAEKSEYYRLDDEINIGGKFSLLAPTFSQAFRWFREKHQIFPEVLTDCTTEPKFVYTYNTFYGNPKDLTEKEWGWENNIGQYSDLYRTYEEAELACLDKLIEIVETKSE